MAASFAVRFRDVLGMVTLCLMAAGCGGTTPSPAGTARSSVSPSAALASSAKPGAATSGLAVVSSSPSATAKPAASSNEQPKPALAGGDPSGFPIRISQAGGAVSGLPLYAAIDSGFFRQQHLNCTIVNMGTGFVAITALTNGDIEFNNTPTDAIVGATRGLPLKMVWEAWQKAPWTLVGKTQYKSLADLKGKAIATTTPGSVTYTYLQAALKKVGMAVSDVQLVTVPGTIDSYNQLLGGTVEAAVLSPPYDVQAEQKGFHEVMFVGDVLDLPYLGLGTSTGFIRDHRPQLVATLRAVMDATSWLKTHPAEATSLVDKYVGTPSDVSKLAVDKMLPLLTDTGESPPQGIQQVLDAQAATTNTTINLKPDQVVDWAPLHEALGKS